MLALILPQSPFQTHLDIALLRALKSTFNISTRLIGVGLEPLGLEEFQQGNFFSGELFVDKDKKAFSKLGFRKLTFLQLFPAILSKKTRDANARAKVSLLFCPILCLITGYNVGRVRLKVPTQPN